MTVLMQSCPDMHRVTYNYSSSPSGEDETPIIKSLLLPEDAIYSHIDVDDEV